MNQVTYWSPSEKGFYRSDLNPYIPEDAVQISAEYHVQLLEGEASGKIIISDDNGYPVLIDPPPLTIEQLSEMALANRDAKLRAAAIRIAPLQDAVDLDDATDEEVALLKKWKQYRVALNRIQDQAGFPTTIDWPVAPE